MNDQELAQFKIDCEIYKTKIDKLEHVTERQEERIVALEKDNSKTDLQFKQIMETLKELKEKTIPSLIAEIQTIKNKPSERYNQVISAFISAGVGGVVGFAISKLFN